MDLKDEAIKFINGPFPLWENNLTNILVTNEWNSLIDKGILTIGEYSTNKIVINSKDPLVNRILLNEGDNKYPIYIEAPSNNITSFYDEHGLVLCSESESFNARTKLQNSFDIISSVEHALDCINQLVRSIQILKQEDPEIDLSYSNPNVPFSIFVSVCNDSSEVSNLRVAESIIHETMHLKLTLIEKIVPLVRPNTGGTYYSPWRDQNRPINGVFHGLFVFRTIFDFYECLLNLKYSDSTSKNYMLGRRNSIHKEIKSVSGFENISELTNEGKILATKLISLQSNPNNP